MSAVVKWLVRGAVGRLRLPRLPRAPLPKQTGGAHRVKTKVLARKAKHKKKELDRE